MNSGNKRVSIYKKAEILKKEEKEKCAPNKWDECDQYETNMIIALEK